MTDATAKAIAVFHTRLVQGEVLFTDTAAGVRVDADFVRLPTGDHGFHIHRAGDLRGKGCKKACDHFHVGPPSTHGGPPGPYGKRGPRHTGDLGNVSTANPTVRYTIKGITCQDLWGRSVIVHADADDYGLGDAPDSKTTGHAGKRIACAVIGRVA